MSGSEEKLNSSGNDGKFSGITSRNKKLQKKDAKSYNKRTTKRTIKTTRTTSLPDNDESSTGHSKTKKKETQERIHKKKDKKKNITSKINKSDALLRQITINKKSHAKDRLKKRSITKQKLSNNDSDSSSNQDSNAESSSEGAISKVQTNMKKTQPDQTSQIPELEIDPKSMAVFKRKGYKFQEKLKSGAYGQVYKGFNFKTNETVAIKIMDFAAISQMFRMKYIPRELKALIECHHKFIVKIFDIIRCNQRLYIFMEYCSNGDLSIFLKKHGPCKDMLAKMWFSQIVEALIYVHTKLKIAHRDIKLDNVLLDYKNCCKLTDFGLAKDSWNDLKNKVELAQTICGTQPYMCPQLIQRISYNPYLADVWALGVLLYCLLQRRYPFAYTDLKVLLSEQMDYPKHIMSAFIIPVTTDAEDLICKMLNPDEKKRITLHEVSEHSYLKYETNTNPSIN